MSFIQSKKQMLMIVGIFALILTLTTVTYSFFNYTRTGALNNLGTGRIYFNSEQNGSLNITNIFPMTSSEAGNANLDTVTVGIVGDTTYANGEEFEISLVDVNNEINGKKIPINYIATYNASSGATIGTSSETYWETRNSKNANIYTLNSTGKVKEGKQVLVGYIKNSATGINGTLTIKAYIDADRIAISDTYPEQRVRTVKATGYSSSNCETILTGVANASTYCASATSLQEAIDNEDLTREQITLLVNVGIVEEYTNGTTSNWVNGRTVLTTLEWNSLSSTPISFKIRAESNEGIWVKKDGAIESCPGCKFMYTTSTCYTTWNDTNHSPSVLTSELYDDYEELISITRLNYFLGVKLNNNNEVTNAFACGVKDNVPFCLEGTLYGAPETATTYITNKTLLQGTSLYNNTCTVQTEYAGTIDECEYTDCGPLDNPDFLYAGASSNGIVEVQMSTRRNCFISNDGMFLCQGEVWSGNDGPA